MAGHQLFKREFYIRALGCLLMASPFFNFFVSVLRSVRPGQSLAFVHFMKVATGAPLMMVMWAATFVIGFMMWRGRRASWISVLVVLGIFIILNLINFNKEVQRGWVQPVIDIMVNLGLFALIATQESHQIKERKKAAGGPIVSFEGVGPWARIVSIDRSQILVRAFGQIPQDIQTRTIELSLNRRLQLRARFNGFSYHGDFSFQFVGVDAATQIELDRWLSIPAEARARRKSA